MKVWFGNAMRAFGHAYLPALVTFAVGLLAMPNLNGVRLYGTVALLAGFAALGKVLQETAPFLTFNSLLPKPWGAYADAVSRTGLGTLAVLLTGMGGAPDLGTARSIFAAGIAGVGAAVVRAIEGLLTPGEHPAP